VKLLLDTHAFLWWLADDPRLQATAREALADPKAVVYVSAVSLWEIAIKSRLGKLDTGSADLLEEISANDFLELPLSSRHALLAGSLPPLHDDPFDRLLIAQAWMEELTLVTGDRVFAAYGVPVLAV
jgi:PIN domain nuclease of toxin-antitoxin system